MQLDQNYAMRTHDETVAVLNQASAGIINDAINRITNTTNAAREIGDKLREHADTLHGSAPETASTASKPHEARAGLIGVLFDALDGLEEAQSYLAYQSGRNSNLA